MGGKGGLADAVGVECMVELKFCSLNEKVAMKVKVIQSADCLKVIGSQPLFV